MKCARCKKEIKTKKERYVRVTDFDKEEKTGELFLHILCWKNLFMEKINNELRKRVGQVIGMFSK